MRIRFLYRSALIPSTTRPGGGPAEEGITDSNTRPSGGLGECINAEI